MGGLGWVDERGYSKLVETKIVVHDSSWRVVWGHEKSG
jgi:hypothetical protein